MPEKEGTISILPVSKMGPQKIVVIPKSIVEIQPKDRVLVVKIDKEILEFLKEIPKKKKFEWTEYNGRRRF